MRLLPGIRSHRSATRARQPFPPIELNNPLRTNELSIQAFLKQSRCIVDDYPFATLAAIVMKRILLSFTIVFSLIALAVAAAQISSPPEMATAREKHLRNVHQLTFGGQNAEAYFSADSKKLIFQSSHGDVKCDQIFEMNLDGSDQHMVSTGKGRTTCSFFYPDGKKILYASTHLASPECPPRPDFSKGYVWGVYAGYDIFTANPDGSNLKQLTKTPGYDAEATISLDGKKIVFTSVRNGDLDIYSMDADGRNVKQLTHELGYDGGPTFSPDGKWIVYRAYHPTNEKDIADYKELLAQNLIRPTSLEIWIMKADGSNKKQITNLGAASFRPGVHGRWQAHYLFVELRSRDARHGRRGKFRVVDDESGRHAAWSASPTATASTASPCSHPTARNWCGPPTATPRRRTRPIFLLGIGCRRIGCGSCVCWSGRSGRRRSTGSRLAGIALHKRNGGRRKS